MRLIMGRIYNLPNFPPWPLPVSASSTNVFIDLDSGNWLLKWHDSVVRVVEEIGGRARDEI